MGSSCSKLKTDNISHTPLGCQQNYWRQISGHQRGCRKSIICQHSTHVFRVVKHCAQTDNCPSLGYKGGAELKAWSAMKNKGSHSTNHIVIQDAAWLVRHARQHQLTWTRMAHCNQHFVADWKLMPQYCQPVYFVSSVPIHWSCSTSVSMTLGKLLDIQGLCYIGREGNMVWEHATTYASSHSCHSPTWELSRHLKLTISFPLLL